MEWKKNLYLIAFGQLLGTLGFQFCIPFLPYFVMELGVDDAQVTLWSSALTAAPSVLLIVFSPIWGNLADKYGRKMMVSRAMVAGFIVVFLMSRVVTVEQLFILRLMQGAFTGIIAANIALVSSIVPSEKLGSSLGLMQMTFYSGTSFGPIVGGLLADIFGYRTSFLIAAFLLLIASLTIIVFVKENFKPPEEKVETTGAEKKSFVESKALLVSPVLFTMSYLLFASQFSINAMFPIIPLFVRDLTSNVAQLSTLSGTIISITGFTAALSTVYMGRLGDAKGYHRVLLISTAATSILFGLHFFTVDIYQLALARAMVGFAMGGILPTANAIIGRSVRDEKRGQAYGISASASYLGNFLGPLLAGIFATYIGMRSVFLLVAGLFLIGLLLIKKSAEGEKNGKAV